MVYRYCLMVILVAGFYACKKDDILPVEEQPADTSQTAPVINLLSSIGLDEQPQTTDSICDIVYYTSNDFDVNALPIGSQAPDFTLPDLTNSQVSLSEVLTDRKPVFIMTGSYTCPVFRNNIPKLNNLIYDYGQDINFFVVYTVEAHPKNDLSPYSGTVWTTNQNVNDGILYRQPKTFGHRLAIINDMTSAFNINCDILIDGPCNEFWYGYGEAPNRAYLIDSTGQVKVSHGWFDYETMDNSIDIYLNH